MELGFRGWFCFLWFELNAVNSFLVGCFMNDAFGVWLIGVAQGFVWPLR